MNDKTVEQRFSAFNHLLDLYAIVWISFIGAAAFSFVFEGGARESTPAAAVWSIPAVALLAVSLAAWQRLYRPDRPHTGRTRTFRRLTEATAIFAAVSPFVWNVVYGGPAPYAILSLLGVSAVFAGVVWLRFRCIHPADFSSAVLEEQPANGV